MSEHRHQWELRLHLDGCHFYSSTHACECGARMETFDERESKSDSYSALWMLPEECDRCAELIAGAEPEHHKELIPA